MSDPYSILGVQADASDDEIKKAYKRLAVRNHPDKDKSEGAQERFHIIQKAYELLTNPQQKAEYDASRSHRHHGVGHEFGHGFGNDFFARFFPRNFHNNSDFNFSPESPDDSSPMDTEFSATSHGKRRASTEPGGPFPTQNIRVEHVFGEPHFSAFPNLFARDRHERAPRRDVSRVTVHCTLEEAFKGVKETVTISKRIQDAQSGAITRCSVDLTVEIPAGCVDGHVVVFPGAGDELNGREQDVEAVVTVQQHAFFARDGKTLRTTMTIPLVDALCGVDTTITCIDGGVHRMHVRDVRPGDVLTIPGRGMPSGRGTDRGDLLVTFNIQYPPPLSDEQRKQVKKAMAHR